MTDVLQMSADASSDHRVEFGGDRSDLGASAYGSGAATRLARRRWLPWLVGASALAATLLIAHQDHDAHGSRERADASAAVHDVGIRLQNTLNNRLALTGALAAYARAFDEVLDQENFERFAEDLTESSDASRSLGLEDPSIRSLQIAPDGVVQYVWPLAGNEAAMGHDIVNDPARGEAVRRSIESRGFVLAGPFDLLQGGTGLVGRSPIFTGKSAGGEFWGFATVVLNFDELLALGDIADDTIGDYQLAIRGRDGLGADGEVFFGAPELFEGNSVTSSVKLPAGKWQLAVVPIDGWSSFGTHTSTKAILLIGFLLAVALTVLLLRWLDAHTRAQRASEDLSVLLESIDGPVISADTHFRVTHWNQTAGAVTGIPSDAAIGRHLDEVMATFMGRRRGTSITEASRLTLVDGEPRTFESVIAEPDHTADDNARGYDFAIAPRGDGGVVLVGVDATARRAHDQITADLAALRQTSTLKDDFLASISHEMRTPLTSVLGLAEMLADGSFGELTEAQKRSAETIGRTGDHLLAVVNQLLDVATIATNGMELAIAPVDLAEIVDSALEIVEPLAESKSIEITVTLEDDDRALEGDLVRLGEVVVNLLSNAVKFTPEGGRVGVDLVHRDDVVQLSVWDTGVGIPASQQHLLFQRFVRLENGTFTAGTGLGLSIVHEIVRLHDGSIEVESEPGVLTTFTVTLPRQHVLTPA